MKHYRSIDDLPIYNWNEIHRTGDLTYLLHDKTKTRGIKLDELASEWVKIYDEYIAKFGFDEKYLIILAKQLEIAELIIEKAESKNESMSAIIEIEKQKLEKMFDRNGKSGDFYESKAVLEKTLGFSIDIRKCTVVEFYSYIKMIERDAKRN